MRKLFRSNSTKHPLPKIISDLKEEDDEVDVLAYHRPPSVNIQPHGSVLKHPNSAPTSPARERQRVHFPESTVTRLEPQIYSHQQRFTLSSGLYLHFEKPPTTHYKFLTTAESIHSKGTLRQLITSASAEDTGNSWDSVTPLPLYAARYFSPTVTNGEKSFYWEVQIQSLGFSKFSSLDGTATPLVDDDAPVEEISQLGLSRSISHQITSSSKQSSGRTGSKLAIGFITKCVTPDTVPFLRRRSSLRPTDEFTFPTSVSGTGVFWTSEDGGSVYIEGKKTRHSIPAGVGDNVGIGITYRVDPNYIPPSKTPSPPPEEPNKKERKKSVAQPSTGPLGLNPVCADPDDLTPLPTCLFVVVNNVRYNIVDTDEPSTNPFDVLLPDYILGTNDVFPCLCVQGAGVEVRTKLGEAVDWEGQGGKKDAELSRLGEKGKKGIPLDDAKDDSKNGTKKSKWWKSG